MATTSASAPVLDPNDPHDQWLLGLDTSHIKPLEDDWEKHPYWAELGELENEESSLAAVAKEMAIEDSPEEKAEDCKVPSFHNHNYTCNGAFSAGTWHPFTCCHPSSSLLAPCDNPRHQQRRSAAMQNKGNDLVRQGKQRRAQKMLRTAVDKYAEGLRVLHEAKSDAHALRCVLYSNQAQAHAHLGNWRNSLHVRPTRLLPSLQLPVC